MRDVLALLIAPLVGDVALQEALGQAIRDAAEFGLTILGLYHG